MIDILVPYENRYFPSVGGSLTFIEWFWKEENCIRRRQDSCIFHLFIAAIYSIGATKRAISSLWTFYVYVWILRYGWGRQDCLFDIVLFH